MGKSVLELEDLFAVATLNANLVNDVVKVTVLLLVDEGVLALAAAGTPLGQPLLNATPMEDLLAGGALNRAC